MNVGDYARTKYDGIIKIRNIKEEQFYNEYYSMGKVTSYQETDTFVYYRDNDMKISVKDIIKSSPNIIDLLKKKDIVIDYKGNIYQVDKIFKDYVFTDKKNKYGQVITLVDYQIKKVITKEEFSFIGYEVN